LVIGAEAEGPALKSSLPEKPKRDALSLSPLAPAAFLYDGHGFPGRSEHSRTTNSRHQASALATGELFSISCLRKNRSNAASPKPAREFNSALTPNFLVDKSNRLGLLS
jgi:hypothetical protein